MVPSAHPAGRASEAAGRVPAALRRKRVCAGAAGTAGRRGGAFVLRLQRIPSHRPAHPLVCTLLAGCCAWPLTARRARAAPAGRAGGLGPLTIDLQAAWRALGAGRRTVGGTGPGGQGGAPRAAAESHLLLHGCPKPAGAWEALMGSLKGVRPLLRAGPLHLPGRAPPSLPALVHHALASPLISYSAGSAQLASCTSCTPPEQHRRPPPHPGARPTAAPATSSACRPA